MAQDGLIAAYSFDGAGHAVSGDRGGRSAEPGGFLWLHCSGTHPATRRRLDEAGLPEGIVETLLEHDPVPRCELREQGVLLILRSVTLLPSAMPDDLHTIRIWCDPGRVVSVQKHPVAAAADVTDGIARGICPSTPGELLTELAERLIDRLDLLITAMIDRVDELEDVALGSDGRDIGAEVARVRLQALALRRAAGPQREALSRLVMDRPDWLLGERDRRDLRETNAQIGRMLDDLNAVRERAALIGDQLEARRSVAMNRNMLLLTMVTVGFAPLHLLSSMFGMNVGGIPGAQDPEAFGWSVVAFAAIGGASVFAMSRLYKE